MSTPMMDPAAAATAAAATAANAVPPATTAATTAPPKAEDDRGEEGTSMDTFCEYQPTALCDSVVMACNGQQQQKEEDDDKTSSTTTTTSATTATSLSSKLTVPSHTSSACESNLLASVAAPRVHPDTAAAIGPLLASSALSPLQAEGVLLAIQRHQRIFDNNNTNDENDSNNNNSMTKTRAGFFLGDGAGIGKGRQISAILRDALCRTDIAPRHLWLSVSRELIQDARRDLTDASVHIDVHDGTAFLLEPSKAKGLGTAEKGLLFLTYQLLISANRLEHIVEWCAGTRRFQKSSETGRAHARQLEQEYDGCIIFDEAHKAKNLANDTKTAQLVLQLQRRLPKARVVYCSATGVSDVKHLAYAERLGLWNTPCNTTSHFANFDAFRQSLESKGLASLELLALELKQQGTFLARTLSWEGAAFETHRVTLDEAQKRTYDQAVKWWTACKDSLQQAVALFKAEESSVPKMLGRIFWSAHQRFFKELAICTKVPFIAKDALEQVQKGCCVVIGLQSTGEAGLQSLLEQYCSSNTTGNKRVDLEQEEFPCLFSTSQAVLANFVQQHFPVAAPPPEAPKLPKKQPVTDAEIQAYQQIQLEIDRIANLPPSEPIPELIAMKQNLLNTIPALQLPPNPLDDLIDRLGGADHVAEMTGRSGRMIRKKKNSAQNNNNDDSYFVYSKRVTNNNAKAAASKDASSDQINLVERRHFMDGKKSFAIISDAASTGISLHAAFGSGGSHKQRMHYTIELPWSADKAVQQLGRSHRSGQESAPVYKLVVTDLGGETRFAAAIAKRLASLGALTKGDRRAATGSDMSEFDLDSKYGRRALKRFYTALLESDMFQSQLQREQQQQQQQQEASVVNAELPPQCLPARKAKEILDQFAQKMIAHQDPMAALLTDNDAATHSALLAECAHALDQVGLDREARSKGEIRVFLNRLSGLSVSRQGLAFSLFMATFEDIIEEAKSTGEFEGTAEDIRATSIEISNEVDLAVDPSCGAQTKLTTLALDRGVSMEIVCQMAVEEANKATTTTADISSPQEPQPAEDDEAEEDDIDDDDDEWISSAKAKDMVAASGFYISRNRIAGRNLILFAKRKFERSAFESEEEALNFDPMGLMVITRPNTGSSQTEMPSRDLNYKYRLAFSCEKLGKLLESSTTNSATGAKGDAMPTTTELIEQESSDVAYMWKEAFEGSKHYNHQNGLAPRLQKVALVTGPVLHVMPALEKAVLIRFDLKDRALKIMRAQVDGRRIVGVRFPADGEAIEKLRTELEKLKQNRKNAGNTFTDEDLNPICNKRLEWCTTERKTMKSFFQVAKKSTPSVSSPKAAAASPNSVGKNGKKTLPNKRSAAAPAKLAPARKKAKTSSISSFFAPARKD